MQAAIDGHHANAPSSALTNWSQIAILYDRLLDWTPTPVVRSNHVAAHAMTEVPAVGLAMVDEIDGLAEYHRFHSTRAELLTRTGQYEKASTAYRRALEFVAGEAERAFLLRRPGGVSA